VRYPHPRIDMIAKLAVVRINMGNDIHREIVRAIIRAGEERAWEAAEWQTLANGQQDIIRALRADPGQTPTQIGRVLGISMAAALSRCRRIARHGYVQRRTGGRWFLNLARVGME
jgi:DNA-binding MarR family transcriptional regulator